MCSIEPAPLTLAINEKPEYDSDDMKVALDSARRLYAVGKSLGPEMTDGESIGLMVFRDSGVKAFREALDEAVRCEQALGAWYLSVVDQLAERIPVETCAITGLWWGELDSPGDLDDVRDHYDELNKRKRAPSVWARPGQL